MNQTNRIIYGDCIQKMSDLPANSVDFILTDPPYLVRYKSRDGQTIRNDNNSGWVAPAYREMYRLLKPGKFCVTFYGWNKADVFLQAFRAAGFRVVGHMVFPKAYTSSCRFLKNQHEQAYLLMKGEGKPIEAIPDVLPWAYTGNRLHPTQKPTRALCPIITAFTKPGDVVLDPFCGCGSTPAAAARIGRDFIGIELDVGHVQTARRRLGV